MSNLAATATAYRLMFEFLGYWRLGSGRGSGFVVQSLTARSSQGLPFIPGRTVKGLVREAVRTTARFQSGLMGCETLWFGKPTSPGVTRFETEPGLLGFDDGQLADDVRTWLQRHPRRAAFCEGFYRQVSATKINSGGMAQESSLRSFEVTVPLTLYAPLLTLAPARLHRECPAWPADLALCLTMLRGMGQQRNRGLGRVVVRLEQNAGQSWQPVCPAGQDQGGS